MGIKEWFFGECGSFVSTEQKVSEEKKVYCKVISIESDNEMVRLPRKVRLDDFLIGYIIFNKESNEFEWDAEKIGPGLLVMKPITMETMISITEKLKDLNGCSDFHAEIASLEERLMQLEMMNTPTLTGSQVGEIVSEINSIRKRLIELI